MDTLAPFIAYSLALGIAAIIPGPGIAALVGHSLGGKLKSSAFFLAGIALGDVTYLTIAVVGLAALAQSFAGALIILKVLGGGYLLYLAYVFWTSDIEISKLEKKKSQSWYSALLTGYAVTISNPKTIIFYMALLPTVLDLGAVAFIYWSALALLTIVILFIALMPYAILAAKARAVLSQPKSLKRLNLFAATFIGGAGTFILGEALTTFLRRT